MKTSLAAVVAAAPLLLIGACGDAGARSGGAEKSHPGHGEPGHSCALCDGLEKGVGESKAGTPAAKLETGVLDLTVKSIDGKDVNLADYKGKVVLIVNVASKCGFTEQYEGLEKLYKAKKDAGLVVLGFPSNDFMGQEPGSNSEIAEFCTGRFGVTFPMFEKMAVTGEQASELYKRLTLAAKDMGGAPSWNFTKYLVGRDGQLVARFGSRTTPDDKTLVAALDAQIKAGKAEPKADARSESVPAAKPETK